MNLYDKLDMVHELRSLENKDLPFKVTRMERKRLVPEGEAAMEGWSVTIERDNERMTLFFLRNGEVMERYDGVSIGSRSLAMTFIDWLNRQG